MTSFKRFLSSFIGTFVLVAVVSIVDDIAFHLPLLRVNSFEKLTMMIAIDMRESLILSIPLYFLFKARKSRSGN